MRLIKRVGALALHHGLRLLPILVVFLEDLLDLHLQLPDLLTLLQVNIAALDRGRAIKEFVLLEELSEIELELPLRLFRMQSVRFLRLILRGQGAGRLASLLGQGVGSFWDQLFVPWEIFLV